MTTAQPRFVLQSRNDVRFRSYQKFGAELKVVDEVGEDDERATPPPSKQKPDLPSTETSTPEKPPIEAAPPEKPAADGAPPIPKLKPKKP